MRGGGGGGGGTKGNAGREEEGHGEAEATETQRGDRGGHSGMRAEAAEGECTASLTKPRGGSYNVAS